MEYMKINIISDMSAMIKLLVLPTVLIFTSCTSRDETKSELTQSPYYLVGEIISERELERSYLHGDDSFGVGPAMSRLLETYSNNKEDMSPSQRLDFFWVLFWHLDLSGGEMELYLKTLNSELGPQFLDRLDNYIAVETRLQRNSKRLEYALKAREHYIEIMKQ